MSVHNNKDKKTYLINKIKSKTGVTIEAGTDGCFYPIKDNYIYCSYSDLFKLIPAQKGAYTNSETEFSTLSSQAIIKKKSALKYGLSLLKNSGQLRRFEYNDSSKVFVNIEVEDIGKWKSADLKQLRYINVTLLIFLLIFMLEYNLNFLIVDQKTKKSSFLPEGTNRPIETTKKKSDYDKYAKKYSSNYVDLSKKILSEKEKVKEPAKRVPYNYLVDLELQQIREDFEKMSDEDLGFLFRSRVFKSSMYIADREALIRVMTGYQYQKIYTESNKKLSNKKNVAKMNRKNVIEKKQLTDVEIRKASFLDMLNDVGYINKVQYYLDEYSDLNEELFGPYAKQTSMPRFYDFICYVYCFLVKESTIRNLFHNQKNPFFTIYGQFIPDYLEKSWIGRDEKKIRKGMISFFANIKKSNKGIERIILPKSILLPQLIWGFSKPINNEALNIELQKENDYLLCELEGNLDHDPQIMRIKEKMYIIRQEFREHHSNQSLFLYLEEEKANKQLKRLYKELIKFRNSHGEMIDSFIHTRFKSVVNQQEKS